MHCLPDFSALFAMDNVASIKDLRPDRIVDNRVSQQHTRTPLVTISVPLLNDPLAPARIDRPQAWRRRSFRSLSTVYPLWDNERSTSSIPLALILGLQTERRRDSSRGITLFDHRIEPSVLAGASNHYQSTVNCKYGNSNWGHLWGAP